MSKLGRIGPLVGVGRVCGSRDNVAEAIRKLLISSRLSSQCSGDQASSARGAAKNTPRPSRTRTSISVARP